MEAGVDPARERRLLQWYLAGLVAFTATLAGLIFLFGGRAAGWLFGVEFVEVTNYAELDSSLRFFGALFLGVSAIIAWSIPRIERADPVVTIAAGAIALGATGRLLSAAVEGWPNAAATTLMLLEAPVIVVPLWQRRIKHRYAAQIRAT
jgi:hypothetical protein